MVLGVEGTPDAALRGSLSRGASESGPRRLVGLVSARRVSSSERDPYRRIVVPRRSSNRGVTRARDRECSGLSGWGKSAEASGRCWRGSTCSKSPATPDLRKLGRSILERGEIVRWEGWFATEPIGSRVVRWGARGALRCRS